MLTPLVRIFLIIGLIFIFLAGLIYLASRINLPLGKLPGDVTLQWKGITCFFPLATSILLSIVLTIIFTIITRFIGRK